MAAQEKMSFLHGKRSMKFDTTRTEYNIGCSEAATFMLGAAAILGLFVTGAAIYAVIINHLLVTILKTIAEIAICIPTIWVVGHIITRKSSPYTPKCGCGARYNFFWTEWWHKKNCLAHTLNNEN